MNGTNLHGIKVDNINGVLYADFTDLNRYLYSPVVQTPSSGGANGGGITQQAKEMVFMGSAFLKKAEGSHPYIYSTKDATGKEWVGGFDCDADLTFGAGHSIKTEEEFTQLQRFIRNSTPKEIDDKVESMLQSDLSAAVAIANNFIKKHNVHLKQHEFDAIVILLINQPVALISSTTQLYKALEKGTWSQSEIVDGFTYTIFDNARIDGLVTRRNNELNLFFNGDYNYYDSKTKVLAKGIDYIEYP